MSNLTEQEQFWSGTFGSEYITRNRSDLLIACKTALWAQVLRRTTGITSAVELGANIGLNLVAIRRLLPACAIAGVEINSDAFAELSRIPGINACLGTLTSYRASSPVDLAFTCGVLIHLDPSSLPAAYETLHVSSRRYIAIIEYYNPSPTEIPYRGHSGKLFKRNFAGELLDRYSDLKLADYGFCWHRDPNWPLDDLTWFLLEKR